MSTGATVRSPRTRKEPSVKAQTPKKLIGIAASTIGLVAVVMAAVAYSSPEYSGAYNDTSAVTSVTSAVTAPLTEGQTGYTIVSASSQASYHAREQFVGKS